MMMWLTIVAIATMTLGGAFVAVYIADGMTRSNRVRSSGRTDRRT